MSGCKQILKTDLNSLKMFLNLHEVPLTLSAAAETCQQFLGAADDFSRVSSRWNIKTICVHCKACCGEDWWRALVLWHLSTFEGSLQVHVDTQHSGQQLLLVLVQTHEDILDWRTAPIHQVGKHAGGAELGREGLVVVQLQLAGKPRVSISDMQGCEGGAKCNTYFWWSRLNSNEVMKKTKIKKQKFYSFKGSVSFKQSACWIIEQCLKPPFLTPFQCWNWGVYVR